MPITVGVGNIISEEGYSLLMSPAAAESVWKALLGHGAIPVGKVSSTGKRASQPLGLGYNKRKAASEGECVIIGDDVEGTVVELPFLARQIPPS
ncbi:hypothetical protein T459_32396 [Capsicum annuum]|uniref:Uncharacterized protein n=1 Tax=Capsicum annuum TaxID=4072 RepID=A0A2G2Y1W3_CAPAN|nr:hypothetical protein T459_32396 [Capsicum annuum]